MTCYSIDIRYKVVQAYHQGKLSIRKLAEQFMISPATVQKFLKQYRETQDLTPQKLGTHRESKLESQKEFILQMVELHPDWTLQQYCEYLAEQRNVDASLSTLCRFLKKENLTLKKKLTGARRLPQKKDKISD
jgi:transposase